MVGDVAKNFGRSFLIAQLTPSFLFIILQATLIERKLLGDFGWSSLSVTSQTEQKITAVLVIAFIGAIFMMQFQTSIIRLYEGYYGQSWCPMLLLLQRQSCRYGKLRQEVDALTKQKKLALEDYYLERDYPAPELLRPTRLGNIIRAAEYYATKMYGIDPITIWPRLVAVLPKTFREQSEEAEVEFRFIINLSFLSLLASLEFLLLSALIKISLGSALIGAAVCLLLCFLCYRFSLAAARKWGEYIRAAFDLYRYDLLKKMGIVFPPSPLNLKVERDIWKLVQKVTWYGQDPGEELVFSPSQATKNTTYVEPDVE